MTYESVPAATSAGEQAIRYAEELSRLYAEERAQRRRAEVAAEQLGGAYESTVVALAGALELRDDATGRHAERVSSLALALARAVVPELAADRRLEYGFLLHDVGKIGIPDAVLLKRGPLDPDERTLVERHPVLGEGVVRRIPYLAEITVDVVRSHHERWDGAGYPDRRRGEEIPLAARIFALADAYDAMTNDRPYRPACTKAEALAEIRRLSGAQFDPGLVDAFVAVAAES